MSKRLAATLVAITLALPLALGALTPASALDCSSDVRPGSYCELSKGTGSLSLPGDN